jgi:hypothetical protein
MSSVSTQDLTRIETAMRDRLRIRLLAILGRIGRSTRGPSVRMGGGAFDDAVEMRALPKRAHLEIVLEAEPSGHSVWRDVEIDLQAADAEYPYFPFCSFVYSGNVLGAAVEFQKRGEKRTAYVRLPTGQSSQVTIVSEAASADLTAEDGPVAVLVGQVRVERVVEAPKSPQTQAFVQQEHLLQHLFPLVTEVARPVFVVGAYRSGTSILAWALGQHPNIWPLDETRWLQLLGEGARAGFTLANSAARNYFETYDISFEEYMAQVGRSIDDFMRTSSLRRWQLVNLGRLAGKIDQPGGHYYDEFQLARSAYNPKRRWVDGTPENVASIPLLLSLFPAARFVLLVRHPLDVIASMMRFERAGGAATDAKVAAAKWTQLTTDGLRAYRAYGPSYVRIVTYADMVEDRLRCLLGIFDFLEEPRFARATETFNVRINSSQLDPLERQRIVTELDEQLEGKEALLALYHETLACMSRPWRPDKRALEEIAEIQNDITVRMMGVVS